MFARVTLNGNGKSKSDEFNTLPYCKNAPLGQQPQKPTREE